MGGQGIGERGGDGDENNFASGAAVVIMEPHMKVVVLCSGGWIPWLRSIGRGGNMPWPRP